MPRAQHKGAGHFSKGNNPCGACAYLGRPYLPETAFSALRMVREQGYSRNIRRIWAHTSSSPFKMPLQKQNLWPALKLCNTTWSQNKMSVCIFQLHVVHTKENWRVNPNTERPFPPAFFLLSVVLSFVSCYLHAFSPTRPLPSTLPSSLLKLKSHLYP